MEPAQVFCPNEACPARGQVGKGNIKVHSGKEERYRCTVCGKTFSTHEGTMFYWKKTPADIIVLVVTLLAHGCPVSAIVAAFGLKAERVRAWAAEAGIASLSRTASTLAAAQEARTAFQSVAKVD